MSGSTKLERAVVGLLAIVGISCTAIVLVAVTYTVITDRGPRPKAGAVSAHPRPTQQPPARPPIASPMPPPSSVVERPPDVHEPLPEAAIARPNGAR